MAATGVTSVAITFASAAGTADSPRAGQITSWPTCWPATVSG